MTRVRLLLVAVIVAAAAAARYAVFYLDTVNIPMEDRGIPFEILIPVAVFLVAALSLISGIAIFILTFLAMKSDESGAFVIKESSLYGKVFLWIAGAHRFHSPDRRSMCAIFWRTNVVIFCAAVVISTVTSAVIATYSNPWKIVSGLLVIVAVVITCATACITLKFLWSKLLKPAATGLAGHGSSRRVRSRRSDWDVVWGTLAAVAVVLIIGAHIWIRGITGFLIMLAKIVAGTALVFLFFWGLYRLFKKSEGVRKAFRDSQFAHTAGNLYEEYLCPRIVIRTKD